MNNVLSRIEQVGLVPVVKIEDAGQAEDLAAALQAGGLPVVEITFRTDAAEAAIGRIAAAAPDLLLGAGTVLSVAQAEAACAAGAKFIVAPGYSPELVRWCLREEVPVTPGVATPTEVTRAVEDGLKFLKFFPAELQGGPKMVKALAGPFVDVRFIPTGGLNGDNFTTYLELSAVFACAGSWLAPSSLIREGRFEEITERARTAVDRVAELRAKDG